MIPIPPVVTAPTGVIPAVMVPIPTIVIATTIIAAATVVAPSAIVTAIVPAVEAAERIYQASENVQWAADDLAVALDGSVIIENVPVATRLHKRVEIKESVHRAALSLNDGRIFVRNYAGCAEAFVRHGVIVASDISNLCVRGRCTEQQNQ
jgi:hypothetical protein